MFLWARMVSVNNGHRQAVADEGVLLEAWMRLIFAGGTFDFGSVDDQSGMQSYANSKNNQLFGISWASDVFGTVGRARNLPSMMMRCRILRRPYPWRANLPYDFLARSLFV